LVGSWLVRRARPLTALFLFALAFALGLLAVLESGDQPIDIGRIRRPDPLEDLLQWIPATGETERAYAAWVALPGAPLDLTAALDRLAIVPAPLALGRSGEFQRTTGVSASQVTGWASANGAGVTVLAGQFDRGEIEASLSDTGYDEVTWRGVSIWIAADPVEVPRIVDGDDLRAMNVVVPLDDRVLVAVDRVAAEAALEAAAGEVDSLASRPELREWLDAEQVAGVMVADQRDLAVECSVSGLWRKSDFNEPSGRTVGIAYHLSPANAAPVTSVWVDLADAVLAGARLFDFEAGWRGGFVNQMGIGGAVPALADVASVRQSGAFVVADLVHGRDNGWVRSGVRYLVDICEQSSTLIPATPPERATPIASPSPEEGQ
jgi:hypothetical protein